METVVWAVERDFGTPTSSDWRYWAFPSRYLDEAWSKDWNLAIKTHDRDACERICEDMPDHWDIRICDHQIVDVTRPNYQNLETRVDELEMAIFDLLSKRSATEQVYDQSYDFLFKSWGRDQWDKLIELSGWTKEDGHKWRTDNGLLMDDEKPFGGNRND